MSEPSELPVVRVEYDGIAREVRIYYEGCTETTFMHNGQVAVANNGVTTVQLPDRIVFYQMLDDEFNEYRDKLQAKVDMGELF